VDVPSSDELRQYPLAKKYRWTEKKTLESKPLKPNGVEKRHAKGKLRPAKNI